MQCGIQRTQNHKAMIVCTSEGRCENCAAKCMHICVHVLRLTISFHDIIYKQTEEKIIRSRQYEFFKEELWLTI